MSINWRMDEQNVVYVVLFSHKKNKVHTYTWLKFENMLNEVTNRRPHYMIPLLQNIVIGNRVDRESWLVVVQAWEKLGGEGRL